MSERGKSGSDRLDTGNWELGMELPSRKEKHARKKGKQQGQQEPVPAPSKASVHQERDEHHAWGELRVAEAETAAASALMPVVEKEVLPTRRRRQQDERDVLLGVTSPDWLENAREADPKGAEEEDKPLATWKLFLLSLFAVLIALTILAWGKLGYVHHVPDAVKQRVPAYAQGEAFLVVKPWWFGPPLFDLSRYDLAETDSFRLWQQELGNYAGILDKPTILWQLQDDLLQ